MPLILFMESPEMEQYITQYPTDGDNLVGKVYINDTQYFDSVPQTASEF